MHTISDLPSFSFSALHSALVAIFGGRPREVDDHLQKKTGDRAPNRVHCRAVCTLAAFIHQQDSTLLVKYAQAVDAGSPGRVLMAATGRPFKNRVSGLSAGAQSWADTVASQILSDLAVLANVERPACQYNGAPIVPPSAQAVSLAPKPAAPATEPAEKPAQPQAKGKGKPSGK